MGDEAKEMAPITEEKDWTDTARDMVGQARAVLGAEGGAHASAPILFVLSFKAAFLRA